MSEQLTNNIRNLTLAIFRLHHNTLKMAGHILPYSDKTPLKATDASKLEKNAQ
jgi:hypothetical protein